MQQCAGMAQTSRQMRFSNRVCHSTRAIGLHIPAPTPMHGMMAAPCWLPVAGSRRSQATLLVASAKSGSRSSTAVADPSETPSQPIQPRVEDRELHVEASESYLAYAMSVIVGRALPDVRDGLKPVHRRILYAMHELGLAHNKPFKKCARVVGEVLGKFHPHGDTAVYDALVRLAQDFSMRHPLINGHGNFGSQDDDPAAAMRYTECKLQGITADMLLEDLDQDVVDFAPNFDASQEEPVVLPAKVPLLLVNGTQGIAVGIATKIPPHNLVEVVEGLSALIKNPDISISELRQYIPAPDFPTGNIVADGPGVDSMYKTGSGSVLIRATIGIEEGDSEQGGKKKRSSAASNSNKSGITKVVVKDVPYQTSKAELVESIAKLVEDKVLSGVADVRDESDRTGIRVVIEVKPGYSAEAVRAALYEHTRLQTRFTTNMVALVNGTPKQLNLKEFLQYFLDFRCEVVERRARHQVATAQKRLSLVQGFLNAMDNLDRVIQIVRDEDSTDAARAGLMLELNLTKEQADAVLALPLRRLTRMEMGALQKEQDVLQDTIQTLVRLLNNRLDVLAIVEKEAKEIADKYGNKRRSAVISEQDVSGSGPDGSDDATTGQPVLVLGTRKGFLQQVPLVQDGDLPFSKGKGRSSLGLRSGDTLQHMATTTDKGLLLVVTPQGRAYRAKASSIPDQNKGGLGASAAQVVNAKGSVEVAGVVALPAVLPPAPTSSRSKKDDAAPEANLSSEPDLVVADEHGAGVTEGGEEGAEGVQDTSVGDWSVDDPSLRYLVMVTREGLIKRILLTQQFTRNVKAGVGVMKMKEGDAIMWCGVASIDDYVAIARNDGRVLLFPVSEVKTTANSAGGAVCMRLSSDDHKVIGATIVSHTLVNIDPEDLTDAGLDSKATSLLMVSARGRAKRVPVHLLKQGSRGQAGVLAFKLTSQRGTDQLAGLAMVSQGDEVIVNYDNGQCVRLPVDRAPVHDLESTGGARALVVPDKHIDQGQLVTGICPLPVGLAASGEIETAGTVTTDE